MDCGYVLCSSHCYIGLPTGPEKQFEAYFNYQLLYQLKWIQNKAKV